MKNSPTLTGSEKQIAWAEDIRQEWIDRADRIRGAAEVLRDTTQIEGEPTITRKYVRELTGQQQGYVGTTWGFGPTKTYAETIRWIRERKAVHGKPHGTRLANADYLTEVADAIEAALETETEARFWIDHR